MEQDSSAYVCSSVPRAVLVVLFFFSSRRRHTRWPRDWSSDVCSSTAYRRGKSFLRLAFFQKRQGLIPPCKWGLGGIFATAKTSVIWVPNIELATTEKEIGRASCRERGSCSRARL